MSEKLGRMFCLASVASVALYAGACAHGSSAKVNPNVRGAGAIERQIQGGGGAKAPRLDHLIPARDSQGSLPKRFEWTAVPGADSYSVGIWNEVDMLIWKRSNIPTNSITQLDDLKLDPGTYFWTISAVRDGEELTSSGLAAFVVRPTNP